MERLDKNFADFLRLLNSHGVEYLVIGGYAVGYHGYVRATGDLDIFVRMSPANASSLVKVFGDFGFTTPELRESLFLQEGKIVRIGLPPVRIEVLNCISGIRFEDAYPNRIEELIDGIRMPFIDLESLLKNKAASGRLKDLADIEGLRKQPNQALQTTSRRRIEV
jgi:predicted nucleotidyltransferase